MYQRRAPTARRKRAAAGSEHLEQVRVVAHLRAFHPDVLFAAVPNGGWRGARQGAALKAEGVRAGYPDLLVDEARGGWFGLRIEMKRADGRGRESRAQADVRRRLGARGYRAVVCAGAAAAIAELEAYLALEPTLQLD